MSNKTCYYCNYYGQCNVETKTCPDFEQFDGHKICNTVSFNFEWKKKHKTWFQKFDKNIQKQRELNFEKWRISDEEK